MYSPISDSDMTIDSDSAKRAKKRKHRSRSPKKSKKHRHHHKSRRHKPSIESPRKRERSLSRDYRRLHKRTKESSRSSRIHKNSESTSSRSRHHDRHRYKSSSEDREKVAKSTSFIGEILRNSKTQILIKPEMLNLVKKASKEVEEGEIHSDRESFTPANTPPLETAKTKEIEINNNWIVVPEEKEEKTRSKKVSVLDLPMPPIVFKKRCSSTPKTPDLDPDQHFSDICQHLDVNPVVISPQDSNPDPNLVKKPDRPTIINRNPPSEDYPDRSFESFEILEKIGEGTYGKVFKARDLVAKLDVAMKFVRMEKESEGFPITGLREVKILRALQHQNIVQLREIVHEERDSKDYGTYLVFEYMNHDLMGLLDNETMIFDEPTIYRIIKQILEGLNYCHKRKILHRDLKCSNILVNNDGSVKLADFGLGREWIYERPYTNKVISLWYRPIELLLGEEKYGTSVDLWSLGCIFGELFQRRAVFPCGTEIGMINAIFNLCGSPTKNSWAEVKFLPGYATMKPKNCKRVLRDTYQSIMSPLALDLFDKLLCLNPAKRITAEEALESNWIVFMDKTKMSITLKLPSERDCHELNAKMRRRKKAEN